MVFGLLRSPFVFVETVSAYSDRILFAAPSARKDKLNEGVHVPREQVVKELDVACFHALAIHT